MINRHILPLCIFVIMLTFLWHGMSLNFFIWGLFHASGWLLTYSIARGLPQRRLASCINFVLFPFFVVVGRLIFSEANSDLLWLKLKQLFLNFSLSPQAWLFHLKVAGPSLALLLLVALCVALEFFTRPGRRRYQLLRQKWAMPLLVFSPLPA